MEFTWTTVTAPCRHCGGTGRYPIIGPCWRCNGSGIYESARLTPVPADTAATDDSDEDPGG